MKTKESFKQRSLKPGTETGSFINMLMSSNSTIPETGKGATILSWSDRHAYEVISVSEDKKKVVIQQYLTVRTDKDGMSECQEYKYETLNGFDETVVWKWGAWRIESEVIVPIVDRFFTKEESKIVFDENGSLKLVDGLTKKVKEYNKVNIIFGIKEEYYDFTF